jgi:hypothetical protein
MKPTLQEARQVALFFYKSCYAGSIIIGSLLFFGISLLVLSQPVLMFAATLAGAIFGWHFVLPSFGMFFLWDLENKVPGLSNATVAWFRRAEPGDFLDMKRLVAQVNARRQQGKR